jgi:hypothetical protein
MNVALAHGFGGTLFLRLEQQRSCKKAPFT